jgi:hypothetical protein
MYHKELLYPHLWAQGIHTFLPFPSLTSQLSGHLWVLLLILCSCPGSFNAEVPEVLSSESCPRSKCFRPLSLSKAFLCVLVTSRSAAEVQLSPELHTHMYYSWIALLYCSTGSTKPTQLSLNRSGKVKWWAQMLWVQILMLPCLS